MGFFNHKSDKPPLKFAMVAHSWVNLGTCKLNILWGDIYVHQNFWR